MFVLLCENMTILAYGVLYGMFYAEIALLKRKQMKEAKTGNQQ